MITKKLFFTSAVLIVMLSSCFGVLAVNIERGGSIPIIDQSVIQYFKEHHSVSLLDVVLRRVGNLGKSEVALGIALAAGVLFLFIGRWEWTIALLVSLEGGEAFVRFAKDYFMRPRPSGNLADGFGFPSGHAFVAMSLYGLLAYFGFRLAKKKSTKIFAICLNTAIILVVGFSRVYRVVHWPSDVLGSFLIGGAWIILLITLLEFLRQCANKESY